MAINDSFPETRHDLCPSTRVYIVRCALDAEVRAHAHAGQTCQLVADAPHLWHAYAVLYRS
jgi:hypothetical protein